MLSKLRLRRPSLQTGSIGLRSPDSPKRTTIQCPRVYSGAWLVTQIVTTQVSLSRALEFGDEPFWVCGEGVEHIPTLFFRR
jgi:hypothetical protein